MAACVFSLELKPDQVDKDKEFTVSMDPPLKPGCVFAVSIDGERVSPGDEVGDIHVIGFRATGEATLRALKKCPKGKIAFTVLCPNCGPTSVDIRCCRHEEQGGIPLSPPAEDYFRALKRESELKEDRKERIDDAKKDMDEKKRHP